MKLPALAATLTFATGLLSPAFAQTPETKAAPKGPVTSHSSTLWLDAKYDVEGAWSIVTTPAKGSSAARTELVLGDSFKTKKGPDLKVVLHPLAASKVKGKNALSGALVLGKLSKYSGASRFVIPADTDLTQFRSLAIHCEEYTVLWGSTDLAQGRVVASGSDWTKKAKKVKGHWEIAEVGDRSVLRLGKDFDTKSGPDLKVLLSPTSIKAVSGKNAMAGARVIAPLKDDEGFQSYDLGKGVKLGDYRTLLIHCESYSKLWAGAELR